MCRLYGLRANEPTKVECTLVYAQNALMAQSQADLRGVSHPDGWGIGFYEGPRATIERRDTAAHEDLHFSVTAERVYAETVVAHVRRATVGSNSQANTHPFCYRNWTFAHNGTVTAFERIRTTLEQQTEEDLLDQRRGTTDSELVFYWLLSRMSAAGLDPNGTGARLELLVEVLREAVAYLDDLNDRAGAENPAKLNFLLTDGSILVATRFRHSLYWLVREGIHDCEICGIPHVHHQPGVDYRAVVLASEPITHESWHEVPEGGVLAVDHTVHAEVYP
ncbi:MAG: class II glutamine amidotransferase [Trueperaceae bacterium]|nr:MAG: class II glutamine amidotransferase [Trueperaceae bacterium]